MTFLNCLDKIKENSGGIDVMKDSSNESVYSMSVVRRKTDLTERKIRYYEAQKLIAPSRTEGKHRLFSDTDVARLQEIKKLLENGNSIADIQSKFRKRGWLDSQSNQSSSNKDISDSEIHTILRNQISKESQFGRRSPKTPFGFK